MTISNTLLEMFAKYRDQHPGNNKALAVLFRVSPTVIGQIRSGKFEKRVRKTTKSRKHKHLISSVAGTVARLATGCGEDEKEWLEKLGFPPGTSPSRVPNAASVDKMHNVILTKDNVSMLLKVVEATGDLPLATALDLIQLTNIREPQ